MTPATFASGRHRAWFFLASLAILAGLRLAQRCNASLHSTALVQDLFYFVPAAVPVVLASLSRYPVAALGGALGAALLFLATPTHCTVAAGAQPGVPTAEIAWLVFSLPAAALGAVVTYFAVRRLG